MRAKPTVYVVDDDQAVRDSLEWLVGSTGLQVRTFEDAQQFLEHFEKDAPGCLVLDVRLPGMSGLELHQELSARGVDIPTVVITGHADVDLAVRAMKSGVLEFIEKPFSDQRLLELINAAVERDATQRRKHKKTRATLERVARLTARERQVLEMVVEGKLNKQIAQELELSPKTVEVHRARVMEKMDASNVAELVRMYLEVRERAKRMGPQRKKKRNNVG